MGGLFHLFDFSQSGTSRKSQKRLIDGLEAPRNSLELPSESSPRYRAMGDKILYSHQVNKKTTKQNISSNGAPMKKLINEEILKDSDRRGVPSIVARLMGMDILPSEIKPAIQVNEKKSKPKQERSPGKEHVASNPYLDKPLNLKSQPSYNLLPHSGETDPDKPCHVFGNPRPREHPQEEQLQKFKKEFEAWQAATVWEQTRVVEGSHKEKRTTYTGSRITRRHEKLTELNSHRPEVAVKPTSARERGDSYHRRYKSDDLDARNPKDFISARNKNKTSSSFEPQTYCNTRDRKYSAATRIVVLKPGLDRSPGSEESWARSSDSIEDEGSIEDFLEEVKEKLRSERRAKKAVKRDFIVIRNGVEFPFDAKPSSSKKIAQNIAKQVRENVSRDIGLKLLRTESMKSYGSEIQVGESEESPEFISREMRKVLSKRLKNVLIGELDAAGITPNESRNSFSRDGFGSGKRSHWENMEDENEFQTNSRNGEQNYQLRSTSEMLPRSNLLRSMSAPVSSGTSFGKLLLEDRHVLTGAQLRTKHEVADSVPAELTRSSSTKEKFNLKGKFSSLNNFTLKSRLFGGKLELVHETESNNGSVFDRDAFTSGPTVMMNLGNTHENCTEVPPSPASVCSTVHEECCEPDESTSHVAAADASAMDEPAESTNLTSKTDVSAMEMDGSHSHVFKVPGDESRPDQSGLDQETATEEVMEEELVVDDAAEMMVTEKAYIKDLLLTSGLYGGGGYESRLSAGADLKWIPLGTCVFDKVEESRKANNSNEVEGESNTIAEQNHKVIFDLVNEALYTILEPCFTTTAVGPTRMPRGKRLLDKVWRMIGMYINPPAHSEDGKRLSFYSLDAVVAHDLGTNSWLDLNLDDSEDQLIGKETAGSILDELIEETVRDAYGVSKLQS